MKKLSMCILLIFISIFAQANSSVIGRGIDTNEFFPHCSQLEAERHAEEDAISKCNSSVTKFSDYIIRSYGNYGTQCEIQAEAMFICIENE